MPQMWRKSMDRLRQTRNEREFHGSDAATTNKGSYMTTDDLQLHVNESIERAYRGESNLNPAVLGIKGFSTTTQRHLLNNIASKLDFYLEVGLFRGATFCATLSGNNDLRALGIEDFSQPFGEDGVEQDLRRNLMPFLSDKVDVMLKDYTKADVNRDPVDLFFYDGEHSFESQARALPHFFECKSDTFLYMVDDFDWPDVMAGTAAGMTRIADKAKEVRRWVLSDGRPDGPNWHNGVALFLMQKL